MDRALGEETRQTEEGESNDTTIHQRSVWLSSEHLGVTAKIDLVEGEAHDGRAGGLQARASVRTRHRSVGTGTGSSSVCKASAENKGLRAIMGCCISISARNA
ncbi:MAG: hypothetical protein U0361_00680 [Nitrospiraceae bacterium]